MRNSQSLNWLERAALQDGNAISSKSLLNYNQLTSTEFFTTAHLQTLVRVVSTIGSGWVATLILLIRSAAQRLIQSGETTEATFLLIDATDVLKDWEYSPQFAEARETSRKYGGEKFGAKYYARLVANDLRVVGQIAWRQLVLRGRAAIAIADLDRMSTAPEF
ncbi:hypothetical protein GCM10020255_008780 [Rhodococcus baikonurensis]